MKDHDIVYLLELFTTTTERGLLTTLRENPEDQATRNALVDFLKEQGREASAIAVLAGYTPGGRDQVRYGSRSMQSGEVAWPTVTSGAIASGSVGTQYIPGFYRPTISGGIAIG